MMKIYSERCDQCLFSPDKIVTNKRRAEILRDCKRRDCHFICHKASMNGEDVCCRGFYETQTSNLIRIMGRLNGIEFVPLPADDATTRD
jgi:hypothetical protein